MCPVSDIPAGVKASLIPEGGTSNSLNYELTCSGQGEHAACLPVSDEQYCTGRSPAGQSGARAFYLNYSRSAKILTLVMH